MNIAILGAGAGGASAVVELSQKGHSTRLWNRSAATLQPLRAAGGIKYQGALGSGLAEPELMSADLDPVLDGADGILVCLPTPAHAGVAQSLAERAANRLPVVLNPGHTGGALEFRAVFQRQAVAPPPIAELSTLTYVARKKRPDTVWTTGVARRVWVAALPGGDAAVSLAKALFPAATAARDVLATGLCNVNMVLHPPGAILGAAWVEATAGDFTFYVQGLTDGVGRIMEALDLERLAVAAAYGHELPTLFEEMQAIGTIESDADPAAGLVAAVRGGQANSRIKAPDSLSHRYYTEDFWFGLRPFLVFAGIVQLEVPVARSLMTLAERLAGAGRAAQGRSAASMGIQGLDKDQLLELLRG